MDVSQHNIERYNSQNQFYRLRAVVVMSRSIIDYTVSGYNRVVLKKKQAQLHAYATITLAFAEASVAYAAPNDLAAKI